MTDAGSLHHSLAAMGFWELALAFLSLTCYALVLNGALGSSTRLWAGVSAALAAASFAALTDPWMNGVILVAIAVAAVGAFVFAAWLISLACGLASEREPVPWTVEEASAIGEPLPASAAVRAGPRTPAHSS